MKTVQKIKEVKTEEVVSGNDTMGYNGNPFLTEVIAYLSYWIIIGMFVYRTYKVGSKYPQD